MIPIRITIKDKERLLRFNQFSNIELYKLLFNDPFASPDMDRLMAKANEMIQDNHLLFYKALIYSGIVGNDYASNLFKPSVTIEEVGEAVAAMTPLELNEFFLQVWNSFFDAMGINLEKIREGETEGEKKK